MLVNYVCKSNFGQMQKPPSIRTPHKCYSNKCSVFFALVLVIMWTVSISTTLCLEYLSISNKMIGRLKFSPRALHSFSLCWASLSRTFPYIEQIVRPPKPFSLSISNIYIFEFHFRIPKLIRIWIKTKNSTRNEKKCFLFSVSSKQCRQCLSQCCQYLSKVSWIRTLWRKVLSSKIFRILNANAKVQFTSYHCFLT